MSLYAACFDHFADAESAVSTPPYASAVVAGSASYVDVERNLAFLRFHNALNECADEARQAQTIVEPRLLNVAESFVRLLPKGIALPEPSISENGDVVLDWTIGRSIFSLIVEPRMLSYASSLYRQNERSHGELPHEGDSVSSKLLRRFVEWRNSAA